MNPDAAAIVRNGNIGGAIDEDEVLRFDALLQLADVHVEVALRAPDIGVGGQPPLVAPSLPGLCDGGDVIPETGGVRKLRWSARGKGKRGGVRVIYYFHNEAFPLLLLTVYAKNQKANLTKAERNDLKKLVPILVRNCAKGRLP